MSDKEQDEPRKPLFTMRLTTDVGPTEPYTPAEKFEFYLEAQRVPQALDRPKP